MITVTVKVTKAPRHLGQMLRRVEKAITDAVNEMAGKVFEEATLEVPVATGDLLASIIKQRAERQDNVIRAVVGAGEPYAAYVEFGTGQRGQASAGRLASQYDWPPIDYRADWPGMGAQPYLTPALVEAEESAKELLEQVIREAWEGLQ